MIQNLDSKSPHTLKISEAELNGLSPYKSHFSTLKKPRAMTNESANPTPGNQRLIDAQYGV